MSTSKKEDLFGWAEARNTDPGTSHAAATSVRGEQANAMEKLVLEALSIRPMTSHDLVEKTGVNWSSITPRIAPLKAKGLIEDSGDRKPGPSGRACIVWRMKR